MIFIVAATIEGIIAEPAAEMTSAKAAINDVIKAISSAGGITGSTQIKILDIIRQGERNSRKD